VQAETAAAPSPKMTGIFIANQIRCPLRVPASKHPLSALGPFQISWTQLPVTT
jgi:hypothetical protein